MKNLSQAFLGGLAIASALLGAQACWHVAPDARTGADAADEDGAEAAMAPFAEGGLPSEGSSPVLPEAGEAGDAAEVESGPVRLPYASPVVAAGQGFACSIEQGQVFCWGDNTYGQSGSTPSSTVVAHPQLVPLGPVPEGGADATVDASADATVEAGPDAGTYTAIAIAAGDHHACAVVQSNAVYCWGLNDSYQLGHASASGPDLICPGAVAGQTLPCTPTPTLVAGLGSAASIGAAGSWTCAIGAGTGAVQCWGAAQPPGSADAGVACGLGSQAQGGVCYPAPYSVAGVAGVLQLAVGYDHACGLLAAPTVDAGAPVICWGSNNEGQVSPSACPQSSCTSPLTRTDLPAPTGVAAGTAFTCALGAAGTVSCFGDNTYGQLGHAPGTAGDQGAANVEAGLGIYNSTPSTVEGISTAISLVAGPSAACALLSDGAVECWGNVSTTASATPTPVTVPGLPLMIGIGSFDGTTACGQATDETFWCWTIEGASGATQIQ